MFCTVNSPLQTYSSCTFYCYIVCKGSPTACHWFITGGGGDCLLRLACFLCHLSPRLLSTPDMTTFFCFLFLSVRFSFARVLPYFYFVHLFSFCSIPSLILALPSSIFSVCRVITELIPARLFSIACMLSCFISDPFPLSFF